MIPVVLLKGVEAVAAARPLGSGREQAFRLLPQLDPGDVLSARIEAKLPDGSFKVLLAGQAMRMSLPPNVAAGDTLSLTFLSHEPRPTFALKEPPQAASSTAQPLLSAAGRLVAATMLQAGEIALPLTASNKVPLMSTPPADGARLSATLAQALSGSGLFYESHLADWVAGDRNLAQIRQEPQARIAQGAPAGAAGAPNVTAAPNGAMAAAAAVAGQIAADATSFAPVRHDQSIDARTVPLVQQQLAAIDGSRILLQLEIWPGQWLQWEIDDEQPGYPDETGTPQCWNTQLRLELPQLGELRAALALDRDGVRIRLETASDAGAALMREHRADLQAALAAAGLLPAAIAIAHNEPA